MADPVTIAFVAAAGASAGSSVLGGMSQRDSLKKEASLLEQQARDVDLQAMQRSTMRREQLRSAMSTIEARRAASGLSLDSPSAMAIGKEINRQTFRDISIDDATAANQKHSLREQAKAKRKGAKMAMIQGTLGAVSSLGQMAGGFGGGGGSMASSASAGASSMGSSASSWAG
jgi:hypothetical protein